MMQLFHDGLISTVCVIQDGKKLQLCKGHPSLCFTPSQELHGLVVGRGGSSLGDLECVGRLASYYCAWHPARS